MLQNKGRSEPSVHSKLAASLEITTGGIVLVGIALRAWQYAGNASLWLDELAIAFNFSQRSFLSLMTEPLARLQAAPPGFLFIEKLVTLTLGNSEYVLRLFPFLCAVAALILFWRLALRVLSPAAAVAAIVLFATAIPLLFYGSTVKQYSCDLVISVLLLHLALDLWDVNVSRKACIRAMMGGAISVWFSQASVLVLFGLGAVLAVKALRDGSLGRLWLVIAVWAAASLAATIAGFMNTGSETRAYMHLFWASGFMPLPIGRAVRALWPLPLFGEVFGAFLRYPFPKMFFILMAAGFVTVWQRRRDAGALLVAPVGATLLAAMAQQYPFQDRLILFLLPNMFLAAGAAIGWVVDWLRRFSSAAAWGAALVLVGSEVRPVAVLPPVYRIEDSKSLLASVQSRFQRGDLMYVYYGAASAVAYYAPRFGFAEESYRLGNCHRAHTRLYFRELDEFRGTARTWIVITHAAGFYRERQDILSYIDTIGVRREAIVIKSTPLSRLPGYPAEAYLYDLSDPQRLRAADAASFPVTGPQRIDPIAPENAVACFTTTSH